MVFVVTSLQCAFLELDALYEYITTYKPRMDDYLHHVPAKTPVAECVGTFKTVPVVMQQLWAAHLPILVSATNIHFRCREYFGSCSTMCDAGPLGLARLEESAHRQ
jgi:hypothetical protein